MMSTIPVSEFKFINDRIAAARAEGVMEGALEALDKMDAKFKEGDHYLVWTDYLFQVTKKLRSDYEKGGEHG